MFCQGKISFIRCFLISLTSFLCFSAQPKRSFAKGLLYKMVAQGLEGTAFLNQELKDDFLSGKMSNFHSG